MNNFQIRYLSLKDVNSAGLTMKDSIDIVEEVLTEHGHKRFENPPKPGIHPMDNAFIHAMPGYLHRRNIGGMKWVSGFGGNVQLKIPTIMGLIVLNSMETGLPLAIMDGTFVTAIRTAAVSAVAAKYLAPSSVKSMGIVGAGIQGRYHILSLKEVLPDIETVRIYDAYEPVLKQSIDIMKDLVPFEIVEASSPQDALEGMDLLITATGPLQERIFKEEWAKEGSLIFPVHAKGWETDMFTKADKFIADDWKQLQTGMIGYYDPLPELYAELGEVVTGQKQGRENGTERIVNSNFGMAIHDILMATKILKYAEEKNLGTMLPFNDDGMPWS